MVDLEPTEHLAFFTYEDRPGMVGTVGKILGDASVNIAGMQVSRDAKGGQALVALSVDSPVPAEVLDEIRGSIAAEMVRGVDLSRGAADRLSASVRRRGWWCVRGAAGRGRRGSRARRRRVGRWPR